MLATTGGFATTVAGMDQPVEFAISLNLPGGIYPDVSLACSHVKIDANTTTDVPAGSRLDEGYPAMSAEFTLSGCVDATDETKDAAWLFGRYQTTSPLYRSDVFRTPVTIDIGVYPDNSAGVPELLRKFTGYVDEYSENTDGSVTFTCIDKRSDLRALPALPTVITAAPYFAGLSSDYLIDNMLRAATGYALTSWPAPRPQCVFAASMRGSIWPEVGQIVTTSATPTFGQGAFGSAMSLATTTYALATSGALTTSNTMFCEFRVTAASAAGDSVEIDIGESPTRTSVVITVTPTAISITVRQSGSTPSTFTDTLGLGASSHYIGILVSWAIGSTSWTPSLYVDGASVVSPGAQTASAARATTAPTSYVTVTSNGGLIEAVQVTAESAPASNGGFVPTAVLDPSLNTTMQFPPNIAAGSDMWQALQYLASAELAIVGFDESGTFRFKNRNTIQAAPVARSLTSTSSLKALGIKSSAAAVINRAQVGYASYSFAATRSTVYDQPTPLHIPPHGSTVLNLSLTSPVFAPGATFGTLADGSTDATQSAYRASIDKAGGTVFASAPAFTLVQTAPDKLQLTISNPTSQQLWFVSPASFLDVPAGTPLLRIAAKVVTANSEVVADFQYPPAANGGAASTRFGEVPFSSSGNPWIQDGDTAMQLAQDIVVGASVPRPDLTGVEIVPDPRLQLTDRVHLQDPDVTQLDEYGVIFGWTITYDSGAFGMSVDIRTDAAPGGWLVGIAGRSEIGVGSSTTGATAYIYPST